MGYRVFSVEPTEHGFEELPEVVCPRGGDGDEIQDEIRLGAGEIADDCRAIAIELFGIYWLPVIGVAGGFATILYGLVGDVCCLCLWFVANRVWGGDWLSSNVRLNY